MKRLATITVLSFFLLFLLSCGNPSTPDPADGNPDTNAEEFAIVGTRVVDQSGQPITVAPGTDLSGEYYLRQETRGGASSRALTDSGNVVDLNIIPDTDIAVLTLTDGRVLLDNGGTSGLVEVLPGKTVYRRQFQKVGSSLYAGADHALWKIDPATGEAIGGALIEGMFVYNDSSGTVDDQTFYFVSPLGNFIYAVKSDSGTKTVFGDATGNVVDGPAADTIKGFVGTQVLRSGDWYINLATGGMLRVPEDGVFPAAGDPTEGILENIGSAFGRFFDERYYLSDHERYFSGGRYDLMGIGYDLGILIPMTSTFIQDWYNKVYTMYEHDRWYLDIRKDGSVHRWHVRAAAGAVTIDETFLPESSTSFTGADSLVDPFWIDADGTIMFSGNAPVRKVVR